MSNDVLAVNKLFYEAFRDFDKMSTLWMGQPYQPGSSVFCLHPGQEPITDRAAIVESWRQIISSEQLDISPANEKVLMLGSWYAVVVCEEIIAGNSPGQAGEVMIASNLFVRLMDGNWGIIGHHAGRKT